MPTPPGTTQEVDAPPGEPLDDLLPELAQADSRRAPARGRAGRRRRGGAVGGVGVQAEQEVGRGEVEEAERVRLDQLGQVGDAAQALGGARDLASRLHLSQAFAEATRWLIGHDAADARHDRGHLGEGPPPCDPLEAANWGDVEGGVPYRALVVELDGDSRAPRSGSPGRL
ncbi:MAG: hypothetical protein U0232_02985 [Thermomicrobiales bacterium]